MARKAKEFLPGYRKGNLGNRWEVIWLDDKGEYHRAIGYSVEGVFKVSFHDTFTKQLMKVIEMPLLLKALYWIPAERTANKLSVKNFK